MHISITPSAQVVRARTELEELRFSSHQEIQELQTKLHNAGLTLATVRQQAAEINSANTMLSTNYNMQQPAQQKESTVGYAALPPMPPMSHYYNAAATNSGLIIFFLDID